VRTEIIGDATLYCGDCRDILPTLGTVDAVVTDPPYGLGKDIANDRPTEADPLVQEVFATLKRVCSGNILAFWAPQRIAVGMAIFKPKRVMVWNKTFALYAPHNVGYRYELIFWVSGRAAMRKRGDVFEAFPIAFKAQGESVGHPTQKPIQLMSEMLLDFTRPNDCVLDPFMGSGSTGVACLGMGRSFVGIEAEPRYFEIACRRIEAAQKQARLAA
jgi:site-specific DNA-methyltransferase (adenine-specific)